jgi:hypothetical protein
MPSIERIPRILGNAIPNRHYRLTRQHHFIPY